MSNNQYNLTYETDLNQGAKTAILPMLFLYDDSNAHVFTVKTTRDGKANSLAGASVHAYFMPSNSEECVYIAGSVDDNGYAVVSLSPACYAFIGRFSLVIRAEMDDAVTSIFRGEGYVGQSHTDAILDPGDALPSLAALEARIEALDAAKAPAGYGLGLPYGGNCPDCNTAVSNGWYNVTNTTANCPVVNGITHNVAVLFVKGRVSRIWQTISSYTGGIEAILQRHSFDSGAAWSEWEWVNPPMALGVEYRTTERWQGKPVYTMLVNLGEFANAGYVDTGINGYPLRCSANKPNGAAIPFINSSMDNAYTMYLALNRANYNIRVTMYGGSSASGTIYAQIWYYKA